MLVLEVITFLNVLAAAAGASLTAYARQQKWQSMGHSMMGRQVRVVRHGTWHEKLLSAWHCIAVMQQDQADSCK